MSESTRFLKHILIWTAIWFVPLMAVAFDESHLSAGDKLMLYKDGAVIWSLKTLGASAFIGVIGTFFYSFPYSCHKRRKEAERSGKEYTGVRVGHNLLILCKILCIPALLCAVFLSPILIPVVAIFIFLLLKGNSDKAEVENNNIKSTKSFTIGTLFGVGVTKFLDGEK